VIIKEKEEEIGKGKECKLGKMEKY